MIKKYTLVFTLFLCSFFSFAQPWTENFNSEMSGTYGTGTININGRDWTREDAGNFSYANSIMGSYAFTINDDNSGAHITTPVLNTCGTVTFDYAYINGNSANVFQLQTSTDGTNFTTINTRVLGASSNMSFVNYSFNINSSSSTTYVRILSDNQNAHLFIDNFSVSAYSSGPEIELQGNGTEIVDGDTIPDLGDDTDFGNVPVTGGTAIKTFTILNTGTADLTLTDSSPYVSLSGSGDFTLTANPSSPISAPGSTSFSITFDPNNTTLQQAVVSIANDDSDEDPYTFTIQGQGVNSNTSDIIISPTYTYNSNIDYTMYQVATITNTFQSIDVVRLDIRDGGGSNDPDALGTTLTDLVFDVVNIDNIRSAALFNGNAPVNNTPTISVPGNTISFSGLSYTAPDNGNASLTLRITFLTTVTDNEQLQFTVNSASTNASGSVFATSNAGGATSSLLNNRNRIEVTASQLAFIQQPSNTNTNGAMAPAVQVAGSDVNNNQDLDWTTNVSITSTGTMTGGTISATPIAGIATFSGIVHTVAGTGFTLSASSSGLTGTVSSTFDITDLPISNGDYRTTGSGNWLSNQSSPAIWERFNGSTWNSSNSPAYNTSDRVYIQSGHTINTNGSFGSSVDLYILDGGYFDCGHSGTTGSIYIQSNGTLKVDAFLTNNGNFDVEDNGTVIIDHLYGNGSETIPSLWNGTENFHPNSTIVFNDYDTEDDYLIPNNTSISSNTYSSYTAVFGNVVIDYGSNLGAGDDWNMLKSGVTINMTHGDLIFRSNDTNGADMRVSSTGTVTSGIGGDFIVEDFYNNLQRINIKTSGTLNFTIQGNMELNAATTRIAAGSNPNSTVNIEGDIIIEPSSVLEFNSTIAASATATINLKGDITVAGSGLFRNINSSNLGQLNFIAIGDGLTDDTTQTIDIASTSSNENRYIDFNVENGSYVQIKNQDFELGTNSSLNVKDGGVFDFGFNGTTALNLAISGLQTGTAFDLDQGGTLKITSPDGITTTANSGNVRVTPSNRTYNQTATFHYIGNQNQVTGNAITNGPTGKFIICDLIDNTTQLTLTNSTIINNSTTIDSQGGALDIRVGQFIETLSSYITGTNGRLVMADGTLYQTPVLSTNAFDLIPRLNNTSITYDLNGDSTIQLNGAGFQVLRGGKAYRNLTFSTSGLKNVSSAPSSITGTILTEDTAILDVENNTMGGSGTNLTMTETSEYITAGTGPGAKPDAQDVYTLGVGTKVTFTNNEPGLQQIRLNSGTDTPYYNIDVEGSSVGTTSLGTGIRLQSGGTFTVKNTGTFKFINTNGFYDSANIDRAISNLNTPNIVLESGSTIEYAGASQFFSDFTGYKNVTISGTGVKSFSPTVDGITVEENLNILSSTVDVDGDIQISEAAKYISVGGNTFIDNGAILDISTNASFVQTGIDGAEGTFTVATNGIARVTKRTSEFNAISGTIFYTYWSSPINNPGNVDVVFPTAYDDRRYYFEASNFIDSEQEVGNNNGTMPGQDDIDDNANDWQDANGSVSMEVGRGYAITASYPPPPPLGPFTDTSTFTGAFNTGNISVPVYKNNNEIDDNNWNFIGNPYPSAISALAFLNQNAIIDDNPGSIGGALFFWSQISAADANNNGNENENFNQDDYAVMNGVGGIAGGATTSAPDPYIPSGQGFFVSFEDQPAEVESNTIITSSVVFKNDMRVTNNNTQFFESNNESQNINQSQNESGETNKLWLDLTSNNGVFSQINIVYIDEASNEYDGWFYDTPRNLSNGPHSILYSIIEDRDEKFAIQAKNSTSLVLQELINLGFSTNIDVATIYSISINNLEGSFLIDNAIYLKDNLLNTIHNLKESNYNFASSKGTFNDRFEIVFTEDALSTNEHTLHSNDLTIIEHNNGHVQFKVSRSLPMKIIEIIDLQGKTIYRFNVTNNDNATYNVSALSNAPYIAKVTFENGQTIIKKDVKRY